MSGVSHSPNIRRGLPRTPGGEPWPIVAGGGASVAQAPVEPVAAPQARTPAVSTAASALPAAEPIAETGSGAAVSAVTATPLVASAVTGEQATVSLRRGLPRTPGGEPWPAVSAAMVAAVANSTVVTNAAAPALASDSPAEPVASAAPVPPISATLPEPEPTPQPEPEPAPQPMAQQTPRAPQVAAQTGVAASSAQTNVQAPKRQVRRIAVWAIGAVAAAGIIVLAARGVTTLPGVPEFLETYPGEYSPTIAVEPGFAPWVRWSHFMNFFFMVLIIRTGLLIRHQQKPDAYFTPKKNGKKVSIYFWLHTSIDLLWLTNGIIFVVLLFITGHWVRIVPTSWEVLPNALSAGLQYLTLEWPLENGWVNYNSLQQLMYFTVVFIAAPLAALTGVRMSTWWPENAPKLNKLYPAPVARAIHYPVMLFFVLFILVHVFLVFTTGALKNLNHMFAGTSEISWVGFAWFVAGVLVTAAVTWAARPLVIAPIANLFGKVSER